MSFDITSLLEQWDYQPGQVMVRRFRSKDGKDKIQLRVDLGLLQMNADGRPDGKRPLGHATLYEFFLVKSQEGSDGGKEPSTPFNLKADDCARLQLELLQFHHRSICFLQLEDYQAAQSDTNRNLEVLDFVTRFAESDDLALSLEQFRPQILLLRTRAHGLPLVKEELYSRAIRTIEDGLASLRECFRANCPTDGDDQIPEIQSLLTWLGEVQEQRPLTRKQRLEIDLAKAIQLEDFEKAAQVRDALRNLNSPD